MTMQESQTAAAFAVAGDAVVTLKHRRFTCMSPTLVRLEFAPDGRFEDRSSMIAHEPKRPIPFTSVEQKERDGQLWKLTTQVEFNIRAAHVGDSWISHDIGGFMAPGKPDKIDHELYLRGLQFGVFNPLLRFHSAPDAGSRLPYDYEDDVNGACRYWLSQRHVLLPYLYTAGRMACDTGIPITRGCFVDYPDDEKAYRFDQFMFGSDMLVAPVRSPNRFKRAFICHRGCGTSGAPAARSRAAWRSAATCRWRRCRCTCAPAA